MNKPSDLVFMLALFCLAIITVGFGVTSVINDGAPTDTRATNFIVNSTTNAYTIQTSGDDLKDGILTNEQGASTEPSEENIIVKGWSSLQQLGRTADAVQGTMSQAPGIFGVDEIYWIILSGALLCVFAVVMYSWIIGGR